MEERLLLVDGHSLANRAFYALPPLSTTDGVPTGAVHGFFSMLLRFIGEKKPTHIAIAFDPPGPTFRHEKFDEYKAQRKPSPPDFIVQIPLLKELLDAMGLCRMEVPGYEADDVIGTLARLWKESGRPATILSGDKDFLQLVEPLVETIVPRKGISEVTSYDPETVFSDTGISPDQVIDYKALRGDTSDNIPGVKGVGEKTAAVLLGQFGTLDQIYARLDEVTPPRTKNLLVKGKESAYLSRDLATIDTHVPLELDQGVECMKWQGPDEERSKEALSRMQLKSIIPKIVSLAKDYQSTLGHGEGTGEEHETPSLLVPAPVLPDVLVIDTPEKLRGFAEDAVRAGAIGLFALEEHVTKDFRWPQAFGVAAAGKSGVVELPGDQDEAIWRVMGPVLLDEGVNILGFGLKWVFTLCAKRGILPKGPFFDSLIAAYLLDPTRNTYNVWDMARGYVDESEPWGGEPASLYDRLAQGARLSIEIADDCARDLEKSGLLALAQDVEFPLVRVLAEMEVSGMGVDLALARSIGAHFADVLQVLEEDIYNVSGERFNLGSPKQLAHILFDKIGLKPTKKTKTGFSTDAGVLEALSEEHELPAKILEYRHYAKLKSTYLDSLEGVVNPATGRIHSTFHQTVTTTGRLSSSEPNLQNIPVRGDLGRSLRRIFVPAEGNLLLASDYSQIELRIMAHMSGDPSMMDAFRQGEDIHARTASEIFGVPIEDVDSDLRGKAKAVNFGIIYGISDFGLARNTRVARGEARAFIDAYWERYPKVREYMDRSIEIAREEGHALTILGRRRPIPDINSRIYAKRGFAERTAINTPIQGSAADIIKLAMVRISRRMRAEGLASQLVLQVHDELIFEVPPAEEVLMRELVREEMEGAIQLEVPLKVDISSGKSWFDV